MQLLDFVALYGMLLMPMGAVIFVDFWLERTIRLPAELRRAVRALDFNWAAGLTWFLTLAVCAALVLRGGVQLYFVSLPGWFLAAILYIALSRLLQRPVAAANSRRSPAAMTMAARVLSWLALAGTIVPPVLFFYGRVSLDQTKLWMLIATVVWFAAAPLRDESARPEEASPGR